MSIFHDSTVAANTAYLQCYSTIKGCSFSESFDRQPAHLKHSGVLKVMEKSAVAAISGPELLEAPATIAFLKTQRLHSFFAAGLNSGAFWPIPFDVKPVAAIGVVTGSVVSPGALIPMCEFNFDGRSLTRRYANALAAVSKDLIEAGGATAVNTLQTLLGSAATAAIDEAVFAEVFANSGTVSLFSSGTTATDFLSDFRLMLDHVNVKGAGSLYWVASRAAANKLNFDSVALQGATPQGGELLGIPLIVSDGLIDDSSGGTLLLIDAGKIAANAESLKIDTSKDAALHMSTTPSDNDPAATMVSMFQTNSIALKSSLTFGFELLGDARAAVLTGI